MTKPIMKSIQYIAFFIIVITVFIFVMEYGLWVMDLLDSRRELWVK